MPVHSQQNLICNCLCTMVIDSDAVKTFSGIFRKVYLKSVSKVSRHFAFSVNIFRNFNAISDFSFAMNSYGHEDNFQPTKIRNPSILLLENEDENFFVYKKVYYCLM